MNRMIALGALVLALSIPAVAQADVQVLANDGSELASFKSASCKKGSPKLLSFTSLAKSDGWRLRVNIFHGLTTEKNISYGSDGDVDFTVSGPGGSFTNLNRPPDAPPGGGAVKFNGKRTRMAIGFTSAFNGSRTDSVGIGGALTCKYPKKKKKKR
jgi:hypothetical protein